MHYKTKRALLWEILDRKTDFVFLYEIIAVFLLILSRGLSLGNLPISSSVLPSSETYILQIWHQCPKEQANEIQCSL